CRPKSFQWNSPSRSARSPKVFACDMRRMKSESPCGSPICTRLMLSTPPHIARFTSRPSIPAASNTATMLVEHASTVENAGMAGSSFASITSSRAMLLQPRLGATVPHTTRSGRALAGSCPAIARATGTESATASRARSGPSTRAKGERKPPMSQVVMSSSLQGIVRFPGHAKALLAVAFPRAPARILDDQVVQRAAGVVGQLLARMLLAPARHEALAVAVPGHLLHGPRLEARDPPPLVRDGGPELVRMPDVVLLVEEPHLVAQHVAEDEEAAPADLELRGVAPHRHAVGRPVGAETAVERLVLRRRGEERVPVPGIREVVGAPFVRRGDRVLAADGAPVGEVADRIEAEQHEALAARGLDGGMRGAAAAEDRGRDEQKRAKDRH